MKTFTVLLAAFHYLAFGFGIWSVFERGRSFKNLVKHPQEKSFIESLLRYDNLWGICGFLILTTGLIKAFGDIEKPVAFYMKNGLFHAKLGMVFVILAIEVYVMIKLLKLRVERKKNPQFSFSDSEFRTMSLLNKIEAHLFVIVPFFAAMVARGIGLHL
ncbi:MAG: DUF2214 family protein [Bdellovibrionota bacterium]